uniref:Uncharacterized protein n=1 Tax=Alexandrium andersonii TaxID=327968 RepID=A0A7S2J9N2_9DINO|mmetsp:Transcript_96726/g.216707  ORF Transcript_96726/g.216707 Transcript_96726/m.216707 type:complete len:246 (+) Transcript_96726:102-839(+)
MVASGRRPRSGPLLLGTLLAVLGVVEVLPWARELFVSPALPTLHRHRAATTARRAEDEEGEVQTKRKFRKIFEKPDKGIDLDGDKLDNLPEWYQETIAGKGGMPRGFMADLVLRSFLGGFNKKKYPVLSYAYTGVNGEPSETDFETAYNNMKREIKEGGSFMENDGKGWIWLVAGQTPGGLYLYLTKAPPYGERPLALIKEDDPDEFFAKVDWYRLYVRLHKWNLWGGTVTKFPYPFGWMPTEKK